MRLLDAPIGVAHSTQRWLRDRAVTTDRGAHGDYHRVVADQVRELSVALRHTARGLSDVVDRVVDTPRHLRRDGVDGPTVTIDLAVAPTGTRSTADILTTIDRLAVTGHSPALAAPEGTRNLASWIADEIDIQHDGHPATAYTARRAPPSPPCPLLRATMAHDLAQATIHAYRHAGFTPRQSATIRASQASAALAKRPGVTLDQLAARLTMPRLDLLSELGDLIELRAVFGIDHRWYPFDVTVLAGLDASAAGHGCGCPVTVG